MEAVAKSLHVIYLRDACTSDVWVEQKRAFFQQQEQHGIDTHSRVNRDEEFVFHLLEIHARFCIKTPCSCSIAVANDITSKSKFLQCNSFSQHRKASNSVLDLTSGLTFTTSSDYTYPANGELTDVIDPQRQDLVASDTGDSAVETPCLTSIRTENPLDTDKDTIPSCPSDTSDEDASHGWIVEDPHEESPAMSHDHETDLIKIETTEKDKLWSVDHSSEEQREMESGQPRMKTAQIVLKKMDVRRSRAKCHSCHKVLVGDRLQCLSDSQQQKHPMKCNACMKEGLAQPGKLKEEQFEASSSNHDIEQDDISTMKTSDSEGTSKIPSDQQVRKGPRQTTQKITVEKSSKKGKGKRHFCLYCKKLNLNLPRHLIRHHSNEALVQRAVLEPKFSGMRKKLFDEIRKKGDYIYNCQVIVMGKGELVVSRRPASRADPSQFVSCPTCMGFFYKFTMWKHKKKCRKTTNMNSSNDLQ